MYLVRGKMIPPFYLYQWHCDMKKLASVCTDHESKMSEGRRSQVVLLDERRLDIIIQSRLYAGELLDIVASHFNIKEKEYFGIAFIDDTGQLSWLQLDKRVLEHDFPKKSLSHGAALTFYFRIKYYVESIIQLRDSATIEAFYLQAKSLVAKGELEIDSDITFQLAALVIQATYGDFIDETTFKNQLKRLPVLPTSTLKEYPSISSCESKVLEHYKSLVGQRRGDAIVNYLSILESLPTYGQHYYEVKDKSGNPCWLGLSYRGISQYDKNDRRVPRRVFLWKQLENLYFRDRKFTVEVHEARRVVHTLSSFNLYEDAIEEPVEEFDDLSSAICDPTTQVSVSRRALAPANVTVYVWYAASPNIAKCIWSMAIAQHQFFLDRSHKKSRTSVVRSLSQIATELCRSVQSLSSASSLSNISRSNSSTSLPTIIIEGELSEESKAATIEMLTALQSRRDALLETLKKKNEELKALCLKEGEITGELPPETPFQPGEPQPQVRRRIGTSFTLSDKFICRAKSKDRETLNGLELDYEIQSKIASAAFKLANDVTARKSVRKIRKISYQQATTKLKDIEQKICTLKREKDTKKKKHPDSLSEGSPEDNKVSNYLGLPTSASDNSIAERNVNTSLSSGGVPPSTSLPQLSEPACTSAPPSPAKNRQRHQSLQHVPIITTEVYEDNNTLPCNVRTRRNSSSYSAASEYDTLSCGSSSIASLGIPYRNRFEANLDIEGTNHYSVPNRRASQAFNDPDELLLDDRNPDVVSQCCLEDNSSNQYVNANILSSSYDERIFHKGDEFISGSENISSVDCAYDKSSICSNGILSSNDSNYQLSVTCDLSKQDRHIHSHSENSLHRQRANSLHHKLEQMHISEPELNASRCENTIPHSYNPPLLRNVLRPTSTILPAGTSNSSVSNQSINQVADLVQASVLLQESKRATSSSCLEHCSPKAKTKEWVETSLDSPVITRKRKPKQSDSSPPTEHCQQVQWLDNGLPTNYSDDSYYGYQTYSKYDDRNVPSNISRFQKSHSPLPSQYSPVGCSPEYRKSNLQACSPQLPHERTYMNTEHLIPEENVYHHYEDALAVQRIVPNFSQHNSNYENVHSNYYNSNFQNNNLHSVSDGKQCLDDNLSLKLGIAEPQQPSKHQHRKINTDDMFASDNLSSINVPDYQNIPTDNQYKSINYNGEVSSSGLYTQGQCDVSEPHPYPHNFSFNESQTVYQDSFSISSDSQPIQNWQQPVMPIAVENPALSPVGPNMSFSPNVEVNVVSVGHFQPYWEETKPYELSDFYKYSTKHRKQLKNSYVNDSVETQTYVAKENCDVSHQYYETSHRENANVAFRDYHYTGEAVHASNIISSPSQHQELITNHVPVFDCSAQVESPAKYYTESSVSSPPKSDPDKSLSFGEMELRISLADTFHEEMVTWYQNQDTVKKATLV